MSGAAEEVTASLEENEVSPVERKALARDISEASGDEAREATSYWQLSNMAPLNETSAAAVARLRAFKPPEFPLWDRVPASRRAAVLLLLYADKLGDLRVVITMRSASLRSFSGHAALPGGKADHARESPWQIARREAWEEIGLPHDDTKIPRPFRIEQLCQLPCSLARTELVVRPCVALLHSDDEPGLAPSPSVDESLIPRLNAREVAAVFSAPFHNFLRAADEAHLQPGDRPLPAGNWYEGSWTQWHEQPWRLHYFYVPVNNQHVTKPHVREGGLASLSENPDEVAEEEENPQRYMVWGMTARILVDTATVAYGERPEFEHNSHFGDERMIEGLEKMGRLGEKKKMQVTGSTAVDAKDGSKM